MFHQKMMLNFHLAEAAVRGEKSPKPGHEQDVCGDFQKLQMPSSYQDLVMILPYVLTLLLLVFFSKHNGAPRALGEIYDKGAR